MPPTNTAADHAARVSGLTVAFRLTQAHADPSPDKDACVRYLAAQVEKLTGGRIVACACGRLMVLSPPDVLAHDRGTRVASCRRCRHQARGHRHR
jgi:hypothetical protein